MRIHPPSIPTKFHPDPSTNNGEVAIFTSVHKKKNNNKNNKVSGLLVRRCARTKRASPGQVSSLDHID